MNDEDIISRVIVEEGGSKLTDDASDSGGITRFGITVPGYTDYLRDISGNAKARAIAADIEALTEDNARSFYRWLMVHTKICRIPNEDVRQVVFDAAVNIGATQPIRWLQLALNLKADGIIGPVTLTAVPHLDGERLCRLFLVEQALFYGRLVSGNLTDADHDGIPDKLEDLNGWLNRWAANMRRVA